MIGKKATRFSQKQILEARAVALAQAPQEKNQIDQTINLISFHLGKETLGIPTSFVFDTQPLKTLNWSKVPSAPPYITGVVNFHSHIFSITNLAIFFGFSPLSITEQTHLLLLKGGKCDDGKEMEMTILSDDLPTIKSIQKNDIFPPDENIKSSLSYYLKGITPDLLSVIDIELLLSDPRLIIQELDV